MTNDRQQQRQGDAREPVADQPADAAARGQRRGREPGEQEEQLHAEVVDGEVARRRRRRGACSRGSGTAPARSPCTAARRGSPARGAWRRRGGCRGRRRGPMRRTGQARLPSLRAPSGRNRVGESDRAGRPPGQARRPGGAKAEDGTHAPRVVQPRLRRCRAKRGFAIKPANPHSSGDSHGQLSPAPPRRHACSASQRRAPMRSGVNKLPAVGVCAHNQQPERTPR